MLKKLLDIFRRNKEADVIDEEEKMKKKVGEEVGINPPIKPKQKKENK